MSENKEKEKKKCKLLTFKGPLVRVYPIRIVDVMEGDVSELRDTEIVATCGSQWKLHMGENVLRLSFEHTNTQATESGNNTILPTINMFLYGDWADIAKSKLKQTAVKKKELSLNIKLPKSCVGAYMIGDDQKDEQFCLMVDKSLMSKDDNAVLEFTQKRGGDLTVITLTNEYIEREKVENSKGSKKRSNAQAQQENKDAGEQTKAGKGASSSSSSSGAKFKKMKTLKNQYITLAEARRVAERGENKRTINLVVLVVSYQRYKTMSERSTHRYMASYNLIDPTMNNVNAAVALNVFGNDPIFFPQIKKCGDMMRLHRVKAQMWNGNLQLCGWPDDLHTTFVVVRRKTSLFTGLPTISTGMTPNNEPKWENMNDTEWELQSPRSKSSWDENDAIRLKALYAWSTCYLSFTTLQDSIENHTTLNNIVKQAQEYQTASSAQHPNAPPPRIERERCDTVCILLQTDTYQQCKGVWAWDGSTQGVLGLGRQSDPPGFHNNMKSMHNSFLASNQFRKIPPVAYQASEWEQYWMTLIKASDAKEEQAAALLNDPDFPNPTKNFERYDPLLTPYYRSTVELNTIERLQPDRILMKPDPCLSGVPVFLRIDDDDLYEKLEKESLGCWVRIRNMHLNPVAFIKVDTHVIDLHPNYFNSKEVVINYMKSHSNFNAHFDMKSATIASPAVSRLAPSTGTTPHSISTISELGDENTPTDSSAVIRNTTNEANSNSRRLISATGEKLESLMEGLSREAPHKWWSAVKISLLPRVKIVERNGKSKFAFPLRLEDDTTECDAILFAQNAVDFFGGITPEDYENSPRIQNAIYDEFNRVINNQIILDIPLKSFVQGGQKRVRIQSFQFFGR